MNKLIIQMLGTSLLGVIALGVLLFLPAGTLAYWQAWVFIVVFVASAEATGVYLALKDPVLLERRMNPGFRGEEQSMTQKIIGSLAVLSTLFLLVFCAFDYRFAWSSVPSAISVLGDVLVVLGLLLDLFVLRENSYAGTSVQTFEGQKVISTGLYAHIRHPMYAGNVIMVVGIPLALGSWWGLLVLALIFPVLIWRILDEEKVLEKDLPGYKEYEQKVRYRLVPYLW